MSDEKQEGVRATAGRPSGAQLKVLRAMQAGGRLVRDAEDDVWYFDGGDRVRQATVQAIYRAGWITWATAVRFHYILTASGRAAISKAMEG